MRHSSRYGAKNGRHRNDCGSKPQPRCLRFSQIAKREANSFVADSGKIDRGSQLSTSAGHGDDFPDAVFDVFDFHPDFANNGLFYTIHTETPNGSPTPDHIPATFNSSDVSFHQVVTEWITSTPSAATFSGTRRELLRVGSTGSNAIHPLGDSSFNPTAAVGDADYGMLYVSGGDWAISGLGRFDALQRTDTLAGTMLRIDPRSPTVSGGIAGLGDYTIPADNPFANDGDPNTLGEIFAYGFRNCHRISWDQNGNMFGMDIGQDNLEEINIILAGRNYGWGEREGTFLNGQAVSGDRSEVFAATASPLFQDPVAQYDHDEGAAISSGFAYTGTLVPELQGKFVFGDIVDGRLLYTDLAEMLAADDGDNTTVALIKELQLNVGGNIQTLQQIIGAGRVDMRLGRDQAGEIFVLSKEDGSIRQFVTIPPPAPSDWALVDDFEGHTVGNNVATVVGPGTTWTGTSTQHTAQVDPSDASNQAMQVSGAPGNAVLRAQLNASEFITAGSTGTVFYRFRTPVAANGTLDHVFGATDNNSITNFDFKSGLRNIGNNGFDLRDGLSPGYEPVATLADETWYSLWMVTTNTNPGTFEVYLQSEDPTDPNFGTQTLLVGNQTDPFDYRINDLSDIINLYFRNANNAGGVAGNDLYFDDIYINSSATDLTDPTACVLADVDLNGLVDFNDIPAFVSVLLGNMFQCEADCDKNGLVDFNDIPPFVNILLNP